MEARRADPPARPLLGMPPVSDRAAPTCRFCKASLVTVVVDLGMSPISNAMRSAEDLQKPEVFYPLRVYVCDACRLVQTMDVHAREELFTGDYTYFSSFSDSWLAHARAYVEMACNRFAIGAASQVVEIASNDGYLLQYFKQRGVPVLGIEPAANVAQVAEQERGIRSLVRFFGRDLAEELRRDGAAADLIVANNVLAHVPGINDFVGGLAVLLKDTGAITAEFPHLLRMLERSEFDTIYHEHYSYLSLLAVEKIFRAHDLALFDVEELPTHGGSLRIFAGHGKGAPPPSKRLIAVREAEASAGLDTRTPYIGFAEQVKETKRQLLRFLIDAKDRGETVVGYGAPAKGNTLLNYCGIRSDFLDYTVDRNPRKQGQYLPGTAIPVHAPERIFETRPDFVLILPWNLREEIAASMAGIRDWGGKFVVPIPKVEIF